MPTSERSPRYPAFPLPVAIQFARMVYEQEKRGTVPPESVSRAMGHNVMSGAAKVKIATLRQYGLLEGVGRGKVRISDRAFALLLNPSPEEYREAVQAAASAPQLFQQIKSAYPDASDPTLRFYLMRDLSFSEDGAERAIKAFRESQEFANQPNQSYNDEKRAEPSQMESVHEDQNVRVYSTSGKIQGTTMLDSTPSRENRKVAYSWPLPDEIDAQVSFSVKPTRRAVERLIAYLSFMRDDIPEAKLVPEIEGGEEDE